MSPVPTPFFIIAGPTAAGKSAVAVAVAERCGGEIVGADAFQIYRGLPVLTAQPSAELRARVPHHFVGEIALTETFDVAQYLRAATARIAEIHARGGVPIVTGGTGLYLRALACGLADLPGADAAIRARLASQPLSALHSQLAGLDPVGAAQIDAQNPRRVIRALEVCLLTGRPFSSFRAEWAGAPGGLRGVVLTLERAVLNARVDQRTIAMFADGVIEEVRGVAAVGPTASQTLGWREIRAHLAGQMSREECFAALQRATRRYAKRQMTWFRRETALEVVEVGGSELAADLAERLAARLAESPANR